MHNQSARLTVVGWLVCICLLVSGFGSTVSLLVAGQASDAAERLRQQVAAIAAGKGSPDRAAAITKKLDAMEIEYGLHSFTKQGRRGTNIIAQVPGTASRTLMLGAHYDRVNVGEGAVDNAASCAMLLELLPRLKQHPLDNLAVRVAFFDLEEAGLLGSQAYVDAARDQKLPDSLREHKLPDAYINFDIFAYGDSLWVMSANADAPLAEAVRAAGREARFPVRIDATYPPSDHLSFIQAEVPSISVSLIDGSEIDGVIQRLRGSRAQADKRPRIFGIIHTPNDTLDKIDPHAVTKALPVVERLLRHFDGRHFRSE